MSFLNGILLIIFTLIISFIDFSKILEQDCSILISKNNFFRKNTVFNFIIITIASIYLNYIFGENILYFINLLCFFALYLCYNRYLFKIYFFFGYNFIFNTNLYFKLFWIIS